MAVVYRAWDRTAGRSCAVKVLGDTLSRDEEFRRRFRGEAEAAAALTHPHIVTVYDWGEVSPHHYIAMEYVPGGTLQDLMRRDGRLGEGAALRIAAEVADALAYAHGRDVVHRDIKPHNILLTQDGHVKVADFGIARTLDATHLTRTGTVMGSAHYISPEQARGDQAAPASDQYALGIVLYEMLAGDVPFTGEAPVAIALKHLHESPPDLRAVRPDLTPATVTLVKRLLAKAPGRRYPTAAALAADLRRIAAPLRRDRGLKETAALPPVRSTEIDTRAMPAQITTRLPVTGADGGGPARPLPGGTASGEVDSPASGPAARARDATPPNGSAWGNDATARLASHVRDTSRMPAVPSPAAAFGGMRPPRGGAGRRGVTRAVLSGIVGMCIVVLALAAYRTTWLATHVTVPSLVGRTVADAGQTVLPLQLGVLATTQRQDARAAVGVILSQEPPAGVQVMKGSVVHLTVSQGSGTVPDLSGLPVAQAARQLEALGLRLGRVSYTPDDRVASGTVIHQFQPPGTHLAPNGAVDVLVSLGMPPLFVPGEPPGREKHEGN